MAAWFFALSLLPSLLPRAAMVQGIVSGVTVMIGYGIGAGTQALWRYLGIPGVPGRARRVLVAIFVGLGLWAAVFTGWRQVGWQNEIRTLYGMEPASPTVWPVILGLTALLAVLILVVARGLRLLFRTVFRWLGRRLPRRIAAVVGSAVLLAVIWSLLTGVLVNGFFAVANNIFAPRDTLIAEDMNRPQVPQRSGSPQSLSSWELLGRQGRYFVGGGPSVAELNAANGGGAKEPIRVYAGLRSADTVQGRANLVLAELKRTAAFDRKVLVVATTTGTGFLDQNGTDPLEFLWNGDTAIAGVQYSYLPSWISLLADQDAVRETSRVVFDTVHQYWSTLPAVEPPQALPLRALARLPRGREHPQLRQRHQRADRRRAHVRTAVRQRDARPAHGGTPARQPGIPPRLRAGPHGPLHRRAGRAGARGQDWGPTRLVYLQHASDPIVFFSPSLAFSSPEWLKDGERGPDVSARMGWFPLVTMWQVLLDLPGAGSIPMGYGHLYSATANLESWVGVTDPPDWTPEKTATLASLLEKRPYKDT